MKVIKNNICYVQGEDLMRYPVPNFLIFPDIDILTCDEYIAFEGERAIEYFESRKDILDYNSVCNLSENELETKIKKTYSKLDKLALKWVEASQFGRDKLDKDKKYQKTLEDLKSYVSSLVRYKIHKSATDISIKYIELICGCKKVPNVSLTPEGQIYDDFDPQYIVDTFAPGGFVEEYCLSEKERKIVKKMRKENNKTITC